MPLGDLKRHLIGWSGPGLLLGFLAVAVIFGGAGQPKLSIHLLIQAAALGVILYCIWSRQLKGLPVSSRAYLILALAWGGYSLFQTLPLPAWLRRLFQGGDEVARGFAALDSPMPAMPLSLTPSETFLSILTVLPPLAIFLLALKLPWRSLTAQISWGVAGLAVLSVILGIVQLSGGRESPAYFYTITNETSPVGLFANINHQAIFLLMALPFIGALGGWARSKWMSGQHEPSLPIFIAGLAFVTVVGVLMAGSLAGYALLLPTGLLTVALVIGRRRVYGLRWRFVLPAFLIGGVVLAIMVLPPLLDTLGMAPSGPDEMSRVSIWLTSLSALSDYWLVGSGIGSFPDVYALYENPSVTQLTNVYVNHAHNDYLELFIEVGFFGALILGLFMGFAVWETKRIWGLKGGHEVRLKRAASIAFWLPFLHSLVDYPLRTPAIACFTALCLAIMLAPAKRTKTQDADAAEKTGPMTKQVDL